MADENWDEEPVQSYDQGAAIAAPELPEIKLFGRWSCGDVVISDMSLEVSLNF